MTTSSKKRRFKQRKAANVQKEITAKYDYDVRKYTKSLECIGPSKVIEDIQNRNEIAVEALCQWTGLLFAGRYQPGYEHNEGDELFYKELIDGGLVKALVDLVNEGCSNELVGEFHTDSFPGATMNFLANVMQDDANPFRLQVASSIGPLISCMVNVVDREYFKSSNHWHMTLKGFIYLIGNLLFSEVVHEETMQVLLEHQGLFDFLVQSMFFGAYRPDIVDESKQFISDAPREVFTSGDSFFDISVGAARAVDRVLEQYNEQTDEGKNELYKIATMPVVSKACDPDCKTLVIFGLIDLIKRYTNLSSVEEKKKWYYILLRLTMGDCVDKEVITSIIDLGFNYTNQYEAAAGVCAVLSGILIPRDGSLNIHGDPDVLLSQPNDKRYAIAIDAGLFEMCLGLVVKYGGQNDNGDGPFNAHIGYFTASIRNILDAANHVSFREKSSKSITNRQQKLMDALDLHKDRIPQNDICTEIFVRLQSIVDIKHGQSVVALKAVCIGCSKALEAKDIKRCSNCNSPYCSRECQVDDWRNGGHKQQCKLLCCKEQTAQLSKAQKKELALHKNVNKAGMDLFHKNTLRFLMMASLMGCDITDCVCVINFCCVPPSMELLTHEEFVSDNFQECDNTEFVYKSREANKDKGMVAIACITSCPNEKDKRLVTMIYYGGLGNEDVSSWSERQDSLELLFKSGSFEDPRFRHWLTKVVDKAESDEDIQKFLFNLAAAKK